MDYENLKDFVFYHSWVRYLDRQKDKDKAKEILWQIMRVSCGLDYDTDNEEIIDIIESFILPSVKAAQSRYDTARNGGRPRKDIDMARVHSLLDEGKTYREIGLEFGVSDKTIQNRLREEETEKTEETGRKKKIPENLQDKDIDIDLDTEKEKNIFLHSNEEKTKAALPPTFDSIRGIKYNEGTRKRYGF